MSEDGNHEEQFGREAEEDEDGYDEGSESEGDEETREDQETDEDHESFTVGIGGDSNLYEELLRRELLPTQSEKSGIFRYESSPNGSSHRHTFSDAIHTSPMISLRSNTLFPRPQPQRKIATKPYKILDAPGLSDDYYLNLVDWGTTNMVAVGLQNIVYLWNASTGAVTKLCNDTNNLNGGDSITSVSWIGTGNQLAVGDDRGLVHIWDVNTATKIRSLTGHSQRVACISWNGTATLSSGSRDKHIIHHDVRANDSHIAKLLSHTQEVCGLKWSPDGKELASGGNDNLLNVWQPTHSSSAPVIQFTQHMAAVKAIAWSPHQHGLLVSGGGTNDKCIRFWNTVSQTPLSFVNTGSQVCNLMWSENVNEIVSTHGFSLNQIYVWKYPTMTPIATLTGHSTRVLYLAASPDGQNIVTGAGDETLQLWNIFPPTRNRTRSSPLTMDIR